MRNRSQEIAASEARTASATWTHSTSYKGCIVVIDCTADPASASVTFKIQGVDPVSDSTWDILESAAVNSVTTRVLRVHPSLTASANLIAKDVLPDTIKIVATAADSDSLTYSVTFIGVD